MRAPASTWPAHGLARCQGVDLPSTLHTAALGPSRLQEGDQVRGVGSALFAGILLLVAGTLNIIYGIAAVSDSKFFVNDTQFVFSSLHTWGWITIILGIIEITAAFSLFVGGLWGRVVGITAASIGAVGALLNVGGA